MYKILHSIWLYAEEHRMYYCCCYHQLCHRYNRIYFVLLFIRMFFFSFTWTTVFCRFGCKTTRIPKDSTFSFNELRQCFHIFIPLFGLLDIHSSKWYSIYHKNRPKSKTFLLYICISVSRVRTFSSIWNGEKATTTNTVGCIGAHQPQTSVFLIWIRTVNI